MKKEYDFSKGERDKFYWPDAELPLPILHRASHDGSDKKTLEEKRR